MILVWIDAATILHRISGTGFLIWLLTTAIVLMSGTFASPQTEPNVGTDDGTHKLRI